MKKTVLTSFLLCMIWFPCASSADDWSQWLGNKRNSVWTEKGIIKSIPETGLKEVWRTPIAAGFSGPAVAGDRVFISDFLLAEGDQSFSASRRSAVSGQERFHCIDRKSGKIVWSKKYTCNYKMSYALGPRATPTVDGEYVYHLGAEGNLFCFQVADGKIVWHRDLKKDYKLKEGPMWGFAAHPLVVGNKLFCIVGGDKSVAVAFDKKTGRELWRSLSAKSQGYCPPTMIKAGGVDQLLIFHPEAINSLNPETGELYWKVGLTPAYDMSIVAPIKYKNYLLVTALKGSTVLLKLDETKPAATEVWRGKGLQPDHNPPVIHEDHIYGVDVNGHLRCIELVTGKRVWESLATCPQGRPAPSTTGFVVRNGDHWYITTEEGELIIAKMDPKGFKELGRAKMVAPTAENWKRKIVWSHPAFSHKCVFARNDKEIVCYSLAE